MCLCSPGRSTCFVTEWVGARSIPRKAHTLLGPSVGSGDQPGILLLVRLLLNDTSPYWRGIPHLSLSLSHTVGSVLFPFTPSQPSFTPPPEATSDRSFGWTHRHTSSGNVGGYRRCLVAFVSGASSSQRQNPSARSHTLDVEEERGEKRKKSIENYVSVAFGSIRLISWGGNLFLSFPPFPWTSPPSSNLWSACPGLSTERNYIFSSMHVSSAFIGHWTAGFVLPRHQTSPSRVTRVELFVCVVPSPCDGWPAADNEVVQCTSGAHDPADGSCHPRRGGG